MYKFRLLREQSPTRRQLLRDWSDLLSEPGSTAEGHLDYMPASSPRSLSAAIESRLLLLVPLPSETTAFPTRAFGFMWILCEVQAGHWGDRLSPPARPATAPRCPWSSRGWGSYSVASWKGSCWPHDLGLPKTYLDVQVPAWHTWGGKISLSPVFIPPEQGKSASGLYAISVLYPPCP